MKKIFWFIIMATVFSSAAYSEILIIANKDVPETALSLREIQEIFLGKRVQWSDNSKIRFVAVGEAEIHSRFLKEYVKLSEADWKIYWKRMVFTGRGLPPEIIDAEAELVDFISKTKGSLGYVSSEKITDRPEKDSVKIITVK